MRLAVFAAVVAAAMALACGGVNMSDDQRTPARAASGERDDDSDDDDDRDAGRKTTADDASTPATIAPADSGTSTPDASAPVPEGSFAAGSELETTANLNLRDGPATTFAVIVTIPIATRVKVQTTSGADGWVHVDHQGTIGYASKMFLKVP